MTEVKEISSEVNASYKHFLDIKKNGKKNNLVLVEGKDLVDACKSADRLVCVISFEFQPRYSDCSQFILTRKLYKNLSSYQSLPQVMGIAKYSLAESITNRIIYLDGIQDPGNLGTIERSALAFGFSSVVLSKDCVSPFNFKAVQASKGSMFELKIAYMELEEIVQKGYELYLTCLDGEDIKKTKINKDGRICLVIGNEGQGIRASHLELPGHKIKLIIDDKIESLNAGVAASIFMYLWS